MTEENKQVLAFNRGVIDEIGLARLDIERYGWSAETMKNWVPRVLGSMMIRPGMQYIDSMAEDLNLVRQMPFIFDEDDTALIEFGVGAIVRIRINDVLLERPAVATTITNQDFAVDPDNTSPPTGWTIDDDADCDSFILSLALELRGSDEGFARCYQTVTVAAPDQGVEHGLRVSVNKGRVRMRVGSTVQGKEYFETFLNPGTHQLAFTPTGDFTIEFANDSSFNARVSSCRLYQGQPVELFGIASTEAQVRSARWAQSGDRIYIATIGGQSVIERRFDGRSWSLTSLASNEGPFNTLNTGSVTLTPSAIKGDYDPFGGGTYVTLTASEPIFSVATNGTLFRLQSQGQVVTDTKSGAGADVFTDPVRVTGSEDAREIGIIIEGTFTATVRLQFAFDENGPWNDQGTTFNSPTSTNYNDGQDGQIIFYRLAALDADYTSGSVTMTINYTGGSITGICKVREYVSPTVVRIGILRAFGGIQPTRDWWQGQWGDDDGQILPNTVAIHEGRLWWAGGDRIWGSVSDDFENHDDETEGDSGPINRVIGEGPIAVINWLLPMARLMIGTTENSANVAAVRLDGNNPLSARSSNFDEPLTPFNFNIRTASSRGCFVDRTGQRLFELVYDVDIQDFKPVDLSIFTPDYNVVGIKQIAVQMKPDIRIHCVRDDGTVGMLVYDRAENVISWCEVELGGVGNWNVEDVAVLPGTVEDQVYYTVEAFNGVTGEERYLLKWSLESEARGGLNNYMADAWQQYDGAPIDTVTGLEHLAGLTVTVWADGVYAGEGQVTQFGTPGELDLTSLTLNGQPNDAGQSSNVIVGLQYTAQWKSSKLASIEGIGLMEHKKVNRIGFLAKWLHYQGLQYGPAFDQLYDLPLVEQGQITPADTVWESYHEEDFGFGGEWEEDSRLCLEGQSPKPATLLCAIAEMESIEDESRR